MRLIAFFVVIASAYPAVAPAQDTTKRSPELQALQHFLGTWDIDLSTKPADGEATKQKSVSVRRRSRGGTFVLFDDPGETELHLAMRYDPESRTYPGVIISGNSRGLVTATWAKKTRTMTFKIDFSDGSKYTGTHRFIGKDRAEVSGAIRNARGDVIVELTFKQTRRKNAAKPKESNQRR